MILGCGVDVTEVARFERELARRGGGLVEELFGPGDLAWCQRRRRACEGYAMAFAAKEALFKALGTGLAGRMTWRDVDLDWPRQAAGPSMRLGGDTGAAAEDLGVTGLHVAVACTREYAAAWVVVTGDRR